jgi:four helix bundle protein
MTTRFIAQDVATQAATHVIAGTAGVPRRLSSLADQAVRAATGVALNIAEARGRGGKDRTYHFRVAYGSAREADAAIAILCISQVGCAKRLRSAQSQLDEVRAMLWRVLHSD